MFEKVYETDTSKLCLTSSVLVIFQDLASMQHSTHCAYHLTSRLKSNRRNSGVRLPRAREVFLANFSLTKDSNPDNSNSWQNSKRCYTLKIEHKTETLVLLDS